MNISIPCWKMLVRNSYVIEMLCNRMIIVIIMNRVNVMHVWCELFEHVAWWLYHLNLVICWNWTPVKSGIMHWHVLYVGNSVELRLWTIRRGTKLELFFPTRMAGSNDHNSESRTGPHPETRVPTNPDIPMATLRELLEALRPRNGNGSRSQIDETNPPTGTKLTNLLLLEMLQKQGEQLWLQNEQIRRLMVVREKRVEEDNSYMFKRFTSHHPPVCDGTPDPKTFEDWIRGMEKLFDALQCPEEWKVGFAVF